MSAALGLLHEESALGLLTEEVPTLGSALRLFLPGAPLKESPRTETIDRQWRRETLLDFLLQSLLAEEVTESLFSRFEILFMAIVFGVIVSDSLDGLGCKRVAARQGKEPLLLTNLGHGPGPTVTGPGTPSCELGRGEWPSLLIGLELGPGPLVAGHEPPPCNVEYVKGVPAVRPGDLDGLGPGPLVVGHRPPPCNVEYVKGVTAVRPEDLDGLGLGGMTQMAVVSGDLGLVDRHAVNSYSAARGPPAPAGGWTVPPGLLSRQQSRYGDQLRRLTEDLPALPLSFPPSLTRAVRLQSHLSRPPLFQRMFSRGFPKLEIADFGSTDVRAHWTYFYLIIPSQVNLVLSSSAFPAAATAACAASLLFNHATRFRAATCGSPS
eukprot:gene15684-21791_t